MYGEDTGGTTGGEKKEGVGCGLHPWSVGLGVWGGGMG